MKPVHKLAAAVLLASLIGALGVLAGRKSKPSQAQPASAASAPGQPANQQPWPGAPNQSSDQNQGSSDQAQYSSAPPAAGQTTNQPPSSSAGALGAAGPAANQNQGAPDQTADDAPGSGAESSPAEELTIPEGTHLYVRLIDPVGSARDRSGDRFAATLDRPIAINGAVVVPQGANVTGRVIWARPSGRLRRPAELGITLTGLQIGNQIYPIETSRRTWRGRSHKSHDAKWIAGLGGAGALIGGIAGHGEGLLIGAASGAGAGTVGAFVTGKKNIYLPSESPLHFVLRRPVEIHGA